ncbi:hypothetical protein [Kitasatospora sp. DSM 101779]|uniref:hypothetical protein n=1 Tax=Kitasatospora sp. DSM 101779 TaxID=2853165 RepID=UPI0021DAEF48|nr:hypothetical protein [Kitasatospora sp. DSM 101779]MCU7827057.1 hypothetical protein [Kitasatospora sp. DSM 101779]
MRFSPVLRAAGVASVIALQAVVAAPSWAGTTVPTSSSLSISGAQISAEDPTELDVDLTVTCPLGEQHSVFVTARQDGSSLVPVWGWATADVTCTGAPQTVAVELTAEPTGLGAVWQPGPVDVFAVLACSPAAEAQAQITLA